MDTIIPPLPSEPVVAAIQEDIDDVDELSEQLAVQSIINEERHDEIVQGVTECQSKLDHLSTEITTLRTSETAESPLLAQIQAGLESLKSEVASLRSLLDLKLMSPTPPVSIVEPEEPNAAVSTEEPRLEEPQVPKVRKFRKL